MSGAAERYEELGLADALRRPFDFPAACHELALVLRLAFARLPKPLQSLVFRHTIDAFQCLPLVQTGHGHTAASILLQAAEASLPKQKRAVAATEFKRAVVAYKRQNKTQLNEGFLHLPQDVLVQIFSFLDMRSLVNVGLVSWTWHEAASDNMLWEMLHNNIFGNCNIHTDKIVPGTIDLPTENGRRDTVANVNWKKEFKRRYQGDKSWNFSSNRVVCAHCKMIIWISSISSVTSHNCTELGDRKQNLRPISPIKVVDYLLGETELTGSSDSEDSDYDESPNMQRLSKLWAYPKLLNNN